MWRTGFVFWEGNGVTRRREGTKSQYLGVGSSPQRALVCLDNSGNRLNFQGNLFLRVFAASCETFSATTRGTSLIAMSPDSLALKSSLTRAACPSGSPVRKRTTRFVSTKYRFTSYGPHLRHGSPIPFEPRSELFQNPPPSLFPFASRRRTKRERRDVHEAPPVRRPPRRQDSPPASPAILPGFSLESSFDRAW